MADLLSSTEKFKKLSIIFFLAFVLAISIVVVSPSRVGVVVFLSIMTGLSAMWIPVMIPITFIVATLIVPDEILPALSGTNEQYGFGLIRLHPASITLFIASFCGVFFKRGIVLKRLKGSRSLIFIVYIYTLFLASISLQTFIFRGFKGTPQCLENYFFPFCFFLYLLTLEEKDKQMILKWYVFAIVIIAIYGLIEYFSEKNYLYDALYYKANNLWYLSLARAGYRITTTIGHPLKNATYFLFALPLSLSLYKKPYNIISCGIVCLAIIATGSRAAVALMVLAMLLYYLHMRFDLLKQLKNMLALLASCSLLYVFLFLSPLGKTLLERMAVSKHSVLIRIYSIKNAGVLIKEYFFLGKGVGLSFDESAHLMSEGTGFENPWIMMIADAGFLTTLMYLAIFLVMFFVNIKYLKEENPAKALFVSFGAILVMLSAFNSFGSRGTINLLVWFNAALLYRFASDDTENGLPARHKT
ncbi:MAG: hypothetical protein PHW46_02790 [Candidatus Omnitrophica bacterium]|nr:hypothetical protein [Candidatus Omnitrophota bacterium]